MDEKKNIAFNFGENWQKFSENSLDADKFKDAVDSLQNLIGIEKIKDRSFLDIGCGSGIFAIAASLLGAKKVTGIDISKESVQASKNNKDKFAPQNNVEFFHKSIFDEDMFEPDSFDIVYSWGVLHHTGNMYNAIDIASRLAAPDGLFVIAIYNKHWSSGTWKLIKRFYNVMPKPVKWLMIWIFYFIIALAKLIVTRKNPFAKKKRGMNFYHDIVDWVGGYPYEYAGKDEIIKYMAGKNFKCLKYVKPLVPTGCNEFVFLNENK